MTGFFEGTRENVLHIFLALGLLTTACTTINLVIMGMLVSFLKFSCVPIFIFVGFLSLNPFERCHCDREKLKNTILDGLTCMFVPCLKRNLGKGTIPFAMVYYIIFTFGYGLTSRACLLQMITPIGDPPVYYCHRFQDISSSDYLIPSFKPRHEVFNHGLFKVEKI